MTSVPSNLKYTKDHEWVEITGTTARVGITDYAQRQLGDIVFVDVPTVGRALDAGEPFGTVESVKSVSDLFLPLSGTVAAVNEELDGSPEDINGDAYGTWIIQLTLAKSADLTDLLTAAEYEALIKE